MEGGDKRRNVWIAFLMFPPCSSVLDANHSRLDGTDRKRFEMYANLLTRLEVKTLLLRKNFFKPFGLPTFVT